MRHPFTTFLIIEGGSMIKKSDSKFIDPRKLDFNHMFTKKKSKETSYEYLKPRF